MKALANKLIIGFIIYGVVITAAFCYGLYINDASHLSDAGSFVSGVTAIFGVFVGSFAIYMYIYAEDIRKKNSDIAWEEKLRLEEALHKYFVSMKVHVQHFGTNVEKNHGIYWHALSSLQDTLLNVRKSSLYRALAVRYENEDFNVAYEITVLEAHIENHMNSNSKEIGQALIVSPHNIYEALVTLSEDDIKKSLTEKLPIAPVESIGTIVKQLLSETESKVA
ncbi:hypothetical protein [Aeromonas veronii]|uniref:hypothetical protein n=1 Tax=Aeromonas veronii TaxID=654 RepID=UPI003BA051A7